MRALTFLFSLSCLGLFLSPLNARAQTSESVFWIQETFGYFASSRIGRVPLDGSSPVDIHPTDGGVGLDIDWTSEKMYWGDRGTIKRSDLDGANVETLITGLNDAFGLALDVASQKIYWVTLNNLVQRANYDGSGLETIHAGADALVGIALDVPRGKLYVSAYNADHIRQMNLDGSGGITLSVVVNAPYGLVVDSDHQRLYIASGDSNSIVSCDLNGLNATSFSVNTFAPFDVDIDPIANKVYWARSPGGIYRADLDGSNQELISNTPSSSMRALKLDIDRDSDGVRNSLDACPTDSHKSTAGFCGCGVLETDTDADGTPDCVDLCPVDNGKTAAGICGCASTDGDANSNSIIDCLPEDALQLKTAVLQRHIDALTLKSNARRRQQVKAALTAFEKELTQFPSSGTDIPKDTIHSKAKVVSRATNTLLNLLTKRGSLTTFTRTRRQTRQSIASLSDLLSTAR